MKIIADTNIYIASMRFAGLRRKLLWKLVEEGHILVLTDFILDELRENFLELYEPSEIQVALENTLHFLATGQIEVKTYEDYAPRLEEAEKLIREKDAPILAATMLPDIDYLVTRDKRDFLEKNEALTKSEWREKIKGPHELLELLS